MRAFFQFKTMAAQLTILVMVILGIFAIVLGLTVFRLTRNWLEESVVDSLEALASARQAAIETQLLAYRNRAVAFGKPNLEIEAVTLAKAEGEALAALHDDLTANMRRKQTIEPYLAWAEVVDMTGAVIAATAAKHKGLNRAGTPTFVEGQIRPFLSDLFLEKGTIYLEASLPLSDEQGNTAAVLVLRFHAKELLAITGDYTNLGETGETVLGTRRGDQIYFLAPLRFDPNLSDIQPAPVAGQRAKPMIHATAGQSGVTRAPDYRNEQVIAAYRPLELTGWGVVVKQDQAEALAGVAQLQTTLLLGIGIALLLGAVVTLPLTRVFTQPLRNLEQAIRRVSAGDLSAGAPVDRQDEVGRLAEAFNEMVARLQTTRDDLARRNQELAAFAYVVSHDLKAPLRGIASLSKWLEEDLAGKLEGEQREQIRLLRERAYRMDSLINDLLEYSRVGRVRNAAASVDTGVLLARVIDSLDPPENIRVTVTPPLPSLQTDELRLGQVFQNLIGNAIQHHPGPRGEVKVSCRDAGNSWEFTVGDDGDGIAPRHHERIFQMFQSLRPPDDSESAGIGLALVKKIVEERGGRVWLESEGKPGQGAAFYFTWPKV